MTRDDNDNALTTVVSSQSFVSPDDRVVIVFETLELGLVGLPVDQAVIDVFREELDEAERFVRQTSGKIRSTMVANLIVQPLRRARTWRGQ
jgi:hypothetical protein